MCCFCAQDAAQASDNKNSVYVTYQVKELHTNMYYMSGQLAAADLRSGCTTAMQTNGFATAQMLEQIPNLLTAFYSVMLAGAHVPHHTGPTKAILTAHLGLIIPLKRDRCHMEVAEHDVIWEQGKVVVFDDMYPHEVWNDTDEDRIILLMHLKRPLRFPGTWLRDLFFAILRASPFVKDGVRNLERWEKARNAA
jgi:hypothetical protein